jgi:hypothetical protein
VTLLQKIDPEVLEMITKAETVQLSAGATSESADYMTKLLTKRLLKFDLTSDNNISLFELVRAQAQRDTGQTRAALLKTVLYRDKHSVTTDPRTALSRMLSKHVGHTDQLDTTFSQADEYLSLFRQYEHFDQELPCELLTEIVKEIFDLFRPGGYTLSAEELDEVTELYFNWVLEYGLDGQMVPYRLFEQWFVSLARRITVSKDHCSGFDVGNVVNTMFTSSQYYSQTDVENNNCMVQ